jgi:putative ABC transport system substrate-binding protein
LVGATAGKILKGQNPSELPVEMSTKIELAINLQTAKSLGLVVRKELLVAADTVIE